MLQQLCTRLGLAANATEVSQAVSAEGFNTAQTDCTLFTGTVDIQYEQSNDLENWTVVGAATAGITAPFTLLATQPITAAYVRIRWTEAAGLSAVLAASINLSAQ